MRMRSLFTPISLLAAVALASAGVAVPGISRAALFETEKFGISADFRLRLEEDRDSQSSSGRARDDRTRARIRARLGMTYKASDAVSFGIHLRSGSDDSQQSPHITIVDFDDNDTGDADFNFDRWYVKGQHAGAWAWAGRNSFPFWKQNELFWDDDVTPAGLATGYTLDAGGNSKLAFNAGYFSLPAGMQQFSGNLGAGQIVFSSKAGTVDLTAAAGLFAFDADPDDPDNALYLQGNGSRDYSIWAGNLQAKLNVAGLPLTLGADYLHNTEDYDAADLAGFSAADNFGADDTDGYVLSAQLGSTKKAGDWLAGYYYARIETFAVNNSFSQDDWMRWGSATQTRSSNFKGHELRGGYAFSENVQLLARLYLIEAISNPEDGNRFRLDLNYSF